MIWTKILNIIGLTSFLFFGWKSFEILLENEKIWNYWTNHFAEHLIGGIGDRRKIDGVKLNDINCDLSFTSLKIFALSMMLISARSFFTLFIHSKEGTKSGYKFFIGLGIPVCLSFIQSIEVEHIYIESVIPYIAFYFIVISISLVGLVFLNQTSDASPSKLHPSFFSDLVIVCEVLICLFIGISLYTNPSFLLSNILTNSLCPVIYVIAKEAGTPFIGIGIVGALVTLGNSNLEWRVLWHRASIASSGVLMIAVILESILEDSILIFESQLMIGGLALLNLILHLLAAMSNPNEDIKIRSKETTPSKKKD